MLQIAADPESPAGDGVQALAQVLDWCRGRPTVVVDPTEGRRALRRVIRWSEESGPIHEGGGLSH